MGQAIWYLGYFPHSPLVSTRKFAQILQGHTFPRDLWDQHVVSLHLFPRSAPTPCRLRLSAAACDTLDADWWCPEVLHEEHTHHLLQLLSLTTIFEFEGLSNHIPALSRHMGSRELQIKRIRQQRAGCCGWQTVKGSYSLMNTQQTFKGKSRQRAARQRCRSPSIKTTSTVILSVCSLRSTPTTHL